MQNDIIAILAIGLRHQMTKFKFKSSNIRGEDKAGSPSAENFGVLMDSQLDMT